MLWQIDLAKHTRHKYIDGNIAAEHGLPTEVHCTGVESYRVGADEREGAVGSRSAFSSRQVDAGEGTMTMLKMKVKREKKEMVGKREGTRKGKEEREKEMVGEREGKEERKGAKKREEEEEE